MKIGIPRALLYTIYLPLWKTFIEELGHEVILSNQTNQEILNNGVKSCVDDACLPVKIFHGHVMNLTGRADVILIPRLISVHPGEFICPKFIGLPEMIKNSVPGNPKLLILNFNARSSVEKGYDGIRELGMQLGASRAVIERALEKARFRQTKYIQMMETGLNPIDILEKSGQGSAKAGIHDKLSKTLLPGQDELPAKAVKGTIGIIGHPYLVYDRYINMNICSKLAARGYRVIFPENISLEEVDLACSRYPKKLFWSYGKRLLGSGLTMLENKQADGLILLTSFGCGIDSFIDELIILANHREFKIPLTTITLDEHTGQAGFDTRLEAFVDMMEWRSRYDNHLPPHGSCVYTSESFI